jgi:hypothetical protein
MQEESFGLSSKIQKTRKILRENEDFGKAKETDIVRDLIYILQGVNGNYIKYSFTDDSYNIQLSVSSLPGNGV